jgi:pilus assembly protein CpaC
MFIRAVTLVCFTFAVGVAHAQEERADWLDIEVGKSVVLETPRVPTAIAVTNPQVVDFQVLGEASKIQLQGISIGTTDLIVQFGRGVPPMIYELTVHRDLSDLIRRIDSIVEGEAPRVFPLGERIVIEGVVDDLDTLEQVALVAAIFDPEFVNLMQVRGDHQVQLEVIFAEVSRTGTRELGLNLLYGSGGVGTALISSTAGGSLSVTHPGLSATEGVTNTIGQAFSTGYALGGFFSPIDLAAVISILDQHQLGKILAQPTLSSLSGQQSSFLAGGQLPIPSPMMGGGGGGAGGGGGVRIEFKDFGVKLAFVPTVLANNVIDVRMDLEISEPDYGIGTRTNGIDVPGFVTRRNSSHLRIESGMTFAVAGLISEKMSFSRSGVPGLGRIPLLGALFRSVRHMRMENEVVIYVTPRLVRPLAPGEVPAPPGTTENNNPSDFELFLLGMDRRPGSRTAQPTGVVGLQR